MKTDLKEIGCEGVDWIILAQDRDRWWAVVNAVMNLRVLAPLSYIYIYIYIERERETGKQRGGNVARDTTLCGHKNRFFGFEGPQAVPVCPRKVRLKIR
jgi:uncharacterized membrane protein